MGNTLNYQKNAKIPNINKNMTEKQIMNYVTEECKKCKSDSDNFIERIVKLNLENTNLEKERNSLKIDVYNLNKGIDKNKKDNKIKMDKINNQITFMNNKIEQNMSEVERLQNEISSKDSTIQKLSAKLLKNNCQRNLSLQSRIKEINSELLECQNVNSELEKKITKSIKSSEDCNAVQVGMQTEITKLENSLQDNNNTINYKDSRISQSDRFISMWRTMSLIFFILFFIFLMLYIFKKGNCGDLEEKLKNLKNLKEIKKI